MLNYAAVLQCCETAWGLDDYSALGRHKYLLVNFERAGDDASLQRVEKKLRTLPCPVIAVGPVPRPLLRSVDVIVTHRAAADRILDNIEQHPIAAMTLVQLLRHNEDSTPLDGLFAESLAYASLQSGAEFSRAVLPQPAALADNGAQEPVVLVERREQQLHIALNRPAARNAYNAAMRDAFYEALQLLRTDKGLTGAVIRGEGSCFSVGGDLSEFRTVTDAATAHAIRSVCSVGQALLELGPALEFQLHRACIGAGIEIPAFGARVVAQRCTFMQLPEIKMGLLPGAGGTVSVLGRVGRHLTAYMALSARKVKAARALEWGLIDAIV